MSERLPSQGELSDSSQEKGIKEELLTALTEEVEVDYPCNPGDPEAEAYFSQLESEFSLLDGLEAEEIEFKATSFLSHLHQCWEATEINGKRQDSQDKSGKKA